MNLCAKDIFLQDTIAESVESACKELDKIFGDEKESEINSKFAGELERFITRQLIKFNMISE